MMSSYLRKWSAFRKRQQSLRLQTDGGLSRPSSSYRGTHINGLFSSLFSFHSFASLTVLNKVVCVATRCGPFLNSSILVQYLCLWHSPCGRRTVASEPEGRSGMPQLRARHYPPCEYADSWRPPQAAQRARVLPFHKWNVNTDVEHIRLLTHTHTSNFFPLGLFCCDAFKCSRWFSTRHAART